PRRRKGNSRAAPRPPSEPAEGGGEDRHEFAGIAFREGIGPVAVDVEDADEPPALPEDRQHDLRPGGGGAGDMAGEGLHVGDDLDLARARRSTADTAIEGNDETAMTALVGADLQKAGRGHAVEPRPVEALVGVVKFAHLRRHERYLVGLALGYALDGLGEDSVVGLHGDSSGDRPGATSLRTPWATNKSDTFYGDGGV